MRKYLVNISLLALVLTAIFSCSIVTRFALIKNYDWQIDSSVKIAFMGASHITRGIDVHSIDYAINLSKPSERYMFTYLKLAHLLANNTSVDTIIVECAPTDIWQHADDKYFVDNEMSEFIPLFYPLFSTEEWKQYSGHYLLVFKFIIQHVFDKSLFFQKQYMKRIGFEQVHDLLSEEMNVKDVIRAPIKGVYGNNINLTYLNKIIDICEKHHKKLFLLYCPVYKPEFYYNQEEYYSIISSLLKDKEEVTYLDYSHFNISNTYRYDAHHLNEKGAAIFTKEVINKVHQGK